MKSPLSHLILIAALALSGGLARAEKADRNKPMNIESDALRYDDSKQSSVFTGRVVLTKGTIIIRGAKIDVRQDAEGYQLGVISGEPGKPAFFRQKRDGVEEFIEGEGELIEYDSRAETVKFVGKAQLRRYQGAVLNDEMTGALIVYNNATDVFTIDSVLVKGAPGAPAGRVRAMLTPKQEPTPGAPGNGPKAPAGGAKLRATTTLGGGEAK